MKTIKRFDEQLVEFIKIWIPEFKKDFFERQRQHDKVIVWLVGLSTGAIALLVSQQSKIGDFSLIYLKLTMLFLAITVFAGVIFRVCFYLIEQIDSDCFFHIESFCHVMSEDVNGPRELLPTCSASDIAQYLKDDMGIDGWDKWLIRDSLPREFWVKLYEDWALLWNKLEKEGLRNIGRTFVPLLGKSTEECEAMFSIPNPAVNQPNARLIALRKTRDFCYLSASVSFLLSILSIALGFLVQ
ncbi:MAG: hypothetical protein NTY45_09375 [Elusimicrobia bacterium]|nr:hypothetical protein [Elusimicrobiota bacterium]